MNRCNLQRYQIKAEQKRNKAIKKQIHSLLSLIRCDMCRLTLQDNSVVIEPNGRIQCDVCFREWKEFEDV